MAGLLGIGNEWYTARGCFCKMCVLYGYSSMDPALDE